jgi:hypothetical protein
MTYWWALTVSTAGSGSTLSERSPVMAAPDLMLVNPRHPLGSRNMTETSRVHLVLFGMQNRIMPSYLAAMNRIPDFQITTLLYFEHGLRCQLTASDGF